MYQLYLSIMGYFSKRRRAHRLCTERSHACGRGKGAMENIVAFYPTLLYKRETIKKESDK